MIYEIKTDDTLFKIQLKDVIAVKVEPMKGFWPPGYSQSLPNICKVYFSKYCEEIPLGESEKFIAAWEKYHARSKS